MGMTTDDWRLVPVSWAALGECVELELDDGRVVLVYVCHAEDCGFYYERAADGIVCHDLHVARWRRATPLDVAAHHI